MAPEEDALARVGTLREMECRILFAEEARAVDDTSP
jgi:hypothetical protein